MFFLLSNSKDRLHSRGRRQNHRRTWVWNSAWAFSCSLLELISFDEQVEMGMCAECVESIALFHCVQCADLYCRDCFQARTFAAKTIQKPKTKNFLQCLFIIFMFVFFSVSNSPKKIKKLNTTGVARPWRSTQPHSHHPQILQLPDPSTARSHARHGHGRGANLGQSSKSMGGIHR